MNYPTVCKTERFADGAVHVLGLFTVTISSFYLVISAAMNVSLGLAIACIIYCTSLMASFVSSASYHLLPIHHWREFLQRLDHTAIYALIAGTFTPLLVHINSTWGYVVLGAVWILAIPAMIYKMIGEEVEPSWSLASYLAIGWMGLLAVPEFVTKLPVLAVYAVISGGIIYTLGTLFYARDSLKYRNAIWHSFVLLGSFCFFFAIWITIFK
jgi:hemolysin III